MPIRCQRLPDSHPRNRDRERPQRRSGRGATPTRRTGNSRQVPGWLWLVAGIGGGMLITSLLKLWVAPESPEPETTATSAQVAPAELKPVEVKRVVETPPAKSGDAAEKSASESRDVTEEAAEPVTRFDFYTLLPEREVIVPERETAAATKPSPAVPTASPTPTSQPASSAVPAAPASAPVAEGAESYLLQAGSFRGTAEAERRRAEIGALGLQARVETVRAGSDTWYRVHAGPFTSRDQLATARSRLSAKGIETLQLRQKN